MEDPCRSCSELWQLNRRVLYQKVNTGGSWSSSSGKHPLHQLSLKSFASACNLNPSSSNFTAITFLNMQNWEVPIHCYSQNCMAVEIWSQCIKRNLTIHNEHLPGVDQICKWTGSHAAQDRSTSATYWVRMNEWISTALQLEILPSSCDSRCSFSNVEGPSTIHVLTICPEACSLPEQASG